MHEFKQNVFKKRLASVLRQNSYKTKYLFKPNNVFFNCLDN